LVQKIEIISITILVSEIILPYAKSRCWLSLYYPSHALPVNGHYPLITYSWTVTLILEHSYFVRNVTNSKIAETKALENLKS
jgi:hypothetical protein